MRCLSELSESEVVSTYGCHVGHGDTAVPCVYPQEEYIPYPNSYTRLLVNSRSSRNLQLFHQFIGSEELTVLPKN